MIRHKYGYSTTLFLRDARTFTTYYFSRLKLFRAKIGRAAQLYTASRESAPYITAKVRYRLFCTSAFSMHLYRHNAALLLPPLMADRI